MEGSLTQKRKQARGRRAKSEAFLKPGALRMGLCKIRRYRRVGSGLWQTPTPLKTIEKRKARRRQQRRNKQIGQRTLREWTRAMIAEAEL